VRPVTHLILTRFSVKATPESPPLTVEWLEQRLRLLEAYCLPGIAGQTCQDFRWVLFCDESTDRTVVDRLIELMRPVAGAEVVLLGSRRPGLAHVLARAAAGSRVVVTTRLDSDDGLALRFVERTHEYVDAFEQSSHETLLINFPHGYKAAPDGLFRSYNPHSAFTTLFERVRPGARLSSVQTGNHGYLHLLHPVHQDASMVGWLQVVHGGNVSNRVLGADVEILSGLPRGDFALRIEALRDERPVPAPQPEGDAERAAYRQSLEESLVRS
jgi:hypothetical protein